MLSSLVPSDTLTTDQKTKYIELLVHHQPSCQNESVGSKSDQLITYFHRVEYKTRCQTPKVLYHLLRSYSQEGFDIF